VGATQEAAACAPGGSQGCPRHAGSQVGCAGGCSSWVDTVVEP
jgi:hypothetical protein